jgi:hypothetical protein
MLELCGGAETVSFSKYLPWQVMYFFNAPPTSQKCAAYHSSLQNFLPQSSIFMVGKAQKSDGARSELNSVFSLERVDQWNTIRTSTIQLYKTIILPVVLCGYQIWSLILREEHRLRIFENRALRRTFRPKREKITGGCRKLCEELHNLYSWLKIIRVII